MIEAVKTTLSVEVRGSIEVTSAVVAVLKSIKALLPVEVRGSIESVGALLAIESVETALSSNVAGALEAICAL